MTLSAAALDLVDVLDCAFPRVGRKVRLVVRWRERRLARKEALRVRRAARRAPCLACGAPGHEDCRPTCEAQAALRDEAEAQRLFALRHGGAR